MIAKGFIVTSPVVVKSDWNDDTRVDNDGANESCTADNASLAGILVMTKVIIAIGVQKQS